MSERRPTTPFQEIPGQPWHPLMETQNPLEQIEQERIFAYVSGPTWRFMYEPGIAAWQRWFHPLLGAGLIRVGDPDEYDEHEVTLTSLGRQVLDDTRRQEDGDGDGGEPDEVLRVDKHDERHGDIDSDDHQN